MKRSAVFNVVWVLLLAGMISGCKGGDGDSKPAKPLPDEDVVDYTTASCEFKADEGQAAATILPNVDLVTSYFGKKFDRNLLKGVLSASTTETVRFAQLTNVTFHSVSPFKKKSCLMASFLPEASSFYQTKFDSVGDSTLGLYLSPKNGLVDGANAEAMILVRRDANRWVFVHEFMHHLFSKEVQLINKTDEELKADVKQAIAGLDLAESNYKKSKSADHGKIYLNLIKRIAISFPEILRRFTLEEMAIESVLSDNLTEGRFTNVPVNQSINGAAYIYQSAKKAESNLNAVLTINKEAQQIILELSAKLTADEKLAFEKSFTDSDTNVAGYKTNLSVLKNRAEKKLRDSDVDLDKLSTGFAASNLAGFNPNDSSNESTNNSSVGCAHSHGADKFANDAGQILRSRQKK